MLFDHRRGDLAVQHRAEDPGEQGDPADNPQQGQDPQGMADESLHRALKGPEGEARDDDTARIFFLDRGGCRHHQAEPDVQLFTPVQGEGAGLYLHQVSEAAHKDDDCPVAQGNA